MTNNTPPSRVPAVMEALADDDAGRRAFVLGWNACRNLLLSNLPALSHLPADWPVQVRRAWVTLREHNQTIPSELLDQMRDILIDAPVDKLDDDYLTPFDHENPALKRLMNAVAMLTQAPCADTGTYFAACLEEVESLLAPASQAEEPAEKPTQPIPHALPGARSLWVIQQGDLLHLLSVKIGATYTSVHDAAQRTKIDVYPAESALGHYATASVAEPVTWLRDDGTCYDFGNEGNGFPVYRHPPVAAWHDSAIDAHAPYAAPPSAERLGPANLPHAILAAQLNKPSDLVTGTSNWAAYIARALLGKGGCA